MKKFLILFYTLALSAIPVLSIEEAVELPEASAEEVIENTLEAPEPEECSLPLEETEKTLKEKLEDVYHLEVEQIDTPNFLFKDILTKHCDEASLWDSFQLWGGYNGDLGLYMYDDGAVSNHYEFNTINVGLDGKMKNNNADFRLMFNYSPLSNRNVVQNLFADVYIATNKIPHHRILVGNSRPPAGMEGSYGPFVLPFLARSQISRTFGTVRKLGARVMGNYSLVDYDLGVYSSDTYFQEFFPGEEFIGWLNFKPLGLSDGKYGKLKIGGGIQGGHRDNDYFVTGAYVGWEYKKFSANFECAKANGYNGTSGFSSDKHASGFYTTLAYRITPKLQALVRYDEFDPDNHINHNNKREYTLGFNYFIKGQGLKLILNYVFCENDSARDSHRVMLGTQLLL